ncbi:radical SAM/SPASM domain-containing protein [Pandoraea pnomenusa]|uniref:radical SAM/SPASM domain-containing protein n=1 Tax=Pandoraea pnomenusa TaxID=93220 RepID=UPI0003D1E5D2|nr:radical SAM/SPASM domain-containing protein [Pandoraea pnomenusa]AHB78648.1 Fe-S oxidoreductase [Pandoraea pnomenusa]
MRFVIDALGPQGRQRFVYDNVTSSLTQEDGRPVAMPFEIPAPAPWQSVSAISRDTPGRKGGPFRRIKIQLGLQCNYACSYCNQASQRPAQEGAGRVDAFLATLATWLNVENHRAPTFEFWGGEPLVYWKLLQPLAEALRQRHPDAGFLLITNGALLDTAKVDWLDRMGFAVGISHDGPGQEARGPDPLEVPSTRAAILDLYRRFKPQGRVSFNAMLHRGNASRAQVQTFFVALTGDADVPIGEGHWIDADDDAGVRACLRSPAEHAMFRRQAFAEARAGCASNFGALRGKVEAFMASIAHRRPASSLGQKCGMDRPDHLAVDLHGNVLTCQNVAAGTAAPNGQPHRLGTAAALERVALASGTHWSRRPECPRCPVLHICRGSCMFLEGPLWQTSCDAAYSDAVVVFALAFELLTGTVPLRIDALEGAPLPDTRRDLFGSDAPVGAGAVVRRVIPIHPISPARSSA